MDKAKTAIYEEYELPSKGIPYEGKIPPHGKIREWTQAEYLRRATPTRSQNLLMAEIMNDLLHPDNKFDTRQLTPPDFRYLMTRVAIAVYGNMTPIQWECRFPLCGHIVDRMDLEKLEMVEFVENDMAKALEDKIPAKNDLFDRSGDNVKLKYLTLEAMEDLLKKKQPQIELLIEVIDEVNGVKKNRAEKEIYARSLNTVQMKVISARVEKLDNYGIKDLQSIECPKCHNKFNYRFSVQSALDPTI